FFFNKQRINAIGQAVFGCGALFFGLGLMSSGLKPLRSLEAFLELTESKSDTPIIGAINETIINVIVHSSTANIGILIALFAEGAIDLKAALPVLMGDNIGTTITAILAAIGSTIAAKRAALTHVTFNLIGTIIFILFLGVFTSVISYFQTQL